jgi:predicted nucleic acid-binding Zn ribbon protein
MPFKHPVLTCPICGDKFRPVKEGKKFCSSKCQKRAWNQQAKQRKLLNAWQAKRIEANIFSLKRLSEMPQFKNELSRDNLISGGFDFSVAPTSFKKINDSAESVPFYADFGLLLQNDSIPTYKIIHLKS